jgi:gluconolactonase
MDFTVLTEDLGFPEGPIWMEDSSVIVVDIEGGRLVRVKPDGTKQVVATPGGGPNGAAIGPSGKIFVCNNGGFSWSRIDGVLFPGHQPPDYSGGRIEVVDINTGKVDRLYDKCDGRALRGPNDIVFDNHGGFYFTDVGKTREHDLDQGAIYYAKADGSSIRTVAYGLSHPNGCGLSPDGKMLYSALTTERILLAFDLVAPGEAAPTPLIPGRPVASFPARQLLDSLAVTADGHVCIATIIERTGVASVDPTTGAVSDNPLPDIFTTNICFGGADMRDAWITLSGTGRLVKARWDRPGLRLNYYA